MLPVSPVPSSGSGTSSKRQELLRIEMTLEEALSLYRLLADSEILADDMQRGLIRTWREFLLPRVSLGDIQSSDDSAHSTIPERI
jgi:hypothetical protein